MIGAILRRAAVAPTGAAIAAVAADALLLRRLAPDVRGKPIFTDEVVTGLISARPLREVLPVVVGDRGGAPAHFVLAHAAFAVSASADTLRWVSVLCAVAAVPISYDLGRRLHGQLAGTVAAVVVATSPLLSVYGSFGRMYALLVLSSALSADLFVRALQRGTTEAVVAAAGAAALLPFVHPYGIFPLAALVAVAAFLWRRKPWRIALLAAAALVVLFPVGVAAARLADRFAIRAEGNASLLEPPRAARYLGHTLTEFAGGGGLIAMLAFLAAFAGAVVIWRRQTAFVVFTAVAIALPIVLLVAVPTGRPEGLAHLATRHLIYALPAWSALIGAGSAALLERLPPLFVPVGFLAICCALVLAPPSGLRDPRTRLPLARVTGERTALEAPATWLRMSSAPGDALYFPSPVYLEALPATRHAWLLDPSPGGVLGRTLRRMRFPVPGAVVAVPLGDARVDIGGLRKETPGAQLRLSDRWLVVRIPGPHEHPRVLLLSLHRAFVAIEMAITNAGPRLGAYLRSNALALCGALRRRGGTCVST